MAIIEVKGVTFSYNGRGIIKDADFSVEKGDFLSIAGPNGAGKSTLLKLMLNILQPEYGRILIDGKDSKAAAMEEKISYVSQRATSFNTDFPSTVSEIVLLGLYRRKLIKYYSAADKKRVDDALSMVGMSDYRSAQIGKLSGGQQQRVFIARALVRSPKIIFLDEPTVGIDTDSVGNICCLLGELNKTHGITVLMVTHDISSILSHANKILNFKENGEIELLKTAEYTKMFSHCDGLINGFNRFKI